MGTQTANVLLALLNVLQTIALAWLAVERAVRIRNGRDQRKRRGLRPRHPPK